MSSLKYRVTAFSPPYGDCTKMAMENQFVYKFSPPYGDSTIWELAHLSMREFSPPYGDGTYGAVSFGLKV